MKNKNTILWAILAAVAVAIIAIVILFWGTLKSNLSGGVEVPANVRSEDMTALLQADKIDEKTLAAYSVVWEENLHATVENSKQQNTDLAAADLKSEVEKANAIVNKLNTLVQLIGGDNRTTINTAVQKAKSDLESAQRFIDSHDGATAEAPAPQSSPANTEAATAAPTGQYVTITGNAVRLRTGPGLNYGVYTQVDKGKTIPLVSTKDDWYCLNYNGRTLYVAKEFARVSGSSTAESPSNAAGASPNAAGTSPNAAGAPSNAAGAPSNATNTKTTTAPSSGKYVTINGSGVRLRTGPGENYGIYAKLEKGARVPYVSTSGDWYCVNYSGRTLYVSSKFADLH